MATSKIAVSEGTGKNVGTYSLSEDAVTKELGRNVLNNSSGTEIGTVAAPVEVNLRSSTVGVATSAKQPALGTAGTASADVISIQGIASMTKLLVTPDSVALPANQSVNISQINGSTSTAGAGTTAAGTQRVVLATDTTVPNVTGNVASGGSDSGNPVKVGGVYNSSAPTLTTGQRGDAQLDASGNLKVNVVQGGSSTAQGTFNTTLPTITNGNTSSVQLDNRGGLIMSGHVASAATDLGNPVKTGAVFNTTPPTVTTGQRVDNQANAAGSLRMTEADLLSGENATYNRMMILPSYSSTNISTSTTTTAKSGPGFLHTITFNNPGAITVASLTCTVYDNTAGSGTKLATITVPVATTDPFTVTFDIATTTGLTIVTAGPTVTADLTVTWL